MTELINHPKHYNETEVEVIDIIESYDLGFGFNLGNSIKYLLRCSLKTEDSKLDIDKAKWYLSRILIKPIQIPESRPKKIILNIEYTLSGRALPSSILKSLEIILLCLTNDKEGCEYKKEVLNGIADALKILTHK